MGFRWSWAMRWWRCGDCGLNGPWVLWVSVDLGGHVRCNGSRRLWVGRAVGFGGSWWAWDGLWVGVFGWLNRCWYGD